MMLYNKYEIGDTVLLSATVREIKQTHDGKILYKVRETDLPVEENSIIGKVEQPWNLIKAGS